MPPELDELSMSVSAAFRRPSGRALPALRPAARHEFVVGPPDDPRRRPPMDAQGHLLCRAPLWWVSQPRALRARAARRLNRRRRGDGL